MIFFQAPTPGIGRFHVGRLTKTCWLFAHVDKPYGLKLKTQNRNADGTRRRHLQAASRVFSYSTKPHTGLTHIEKDGFSDTTSQPNPLELPGSRQNIPSVGTEHTAAENPATAKPESGSVQPASRTQSPKLWSHRLYKNEDGKPVIVHYCKSLKNAEKVAQHFIDDEILGLDLEWKAQASSSDSIQDNVSLIQLANQNRIALFQISRFKPAKGTKDLVPPSLRRILESSDITKVGVAIKADCTRLRKYLGIDTRAIFELSHLYKLVKYCESDPAKINKRPVNLSEQVEEHFGLPLRKEEDVRCSDWTSALKYSQVQYAAADPYACIRLYHAMDTKRKAFDPSPPSPAHADSNLPIRIAQDTIVNTDSDEVEVLEPEDGSEEPKK